MASPYVIDFRDVFRFPQPPGELWAALERADRFELWWGWLSEFRLDGGVLRPGAVLHGVVTPPLPYRMTLHVEVEDCERPSLIDAAVHGDLEGRAALVLEAEGTGTRVEASWTLEMMQPPMRMAARLAYPLLRWGHDRVVEATVRSFRRHISEGSARDPGMA